MASGANVGDGYGGGRVRILMMDEYNRFPWSFFSHHKGSSWHGKDARLIFWMGSHWMMLTAAGFIVAGIIGAGLWWVYGRVLLLGQRRCKQRGGYLDRLGWGKGIKLAYELAERHEV